MSEPDTLDQARSTPPNEVGSLGGAARFAPGAIAGISSPMVGRDAELQQLIAAAYGVIEGGPPHLVTVVGPAGIGKSRLAHELRQLLGRLPEPVILLTLQADRPSNSQPYSLVRLIITALFRLRAGDGPEAVRARLEEGVASVMGENSAEQAHFIGQLAGFDFSASPHLSGLLAEPRQIRDRALHYAAQCLARLTAQAPMVLIIDDLHDADEGSLDALTQLLGASEPVSLLAIGLAQGRLLERRPDWGAALGARAELIELRPLEERDGRRLVAEILRKAGKLPPDLRNLIVSRAEGNPFYVEELVKMLIADGVIVPGETSWSVQQTRLSRLRVPATLSELLRARIQALTLEERELLLRAAVVGRSFWVEAAIGLCDVGHHSEQGARALLAAMERKELITPVDDSRLPGKGEYMFRHELLHEVAYAQLPPEQRAGLHQRVAHWLMEHSGERAGAYAGLIGEHFERGGQRDEAARWYVRAGQHARETYAVETAIPHYQTALGLLPATATAELIACHEGLGELQLAAARMGEAEASYLRMAELAEAAGDLLAAARAWHGIAYVQDNNLNYHGSRESALRAVAFAERADRPGALALSLWHLARAEVRHDNPQAVLELGQRALEALARADDRTTAARWSGMLGIAYDLLGDVRRAVAFQQEALAHYRAVGNRSETATQLNNLGYTCNFHGDFASALGYLEEARAECQAIGSRMVEIFVLSNLGIALNGLGDYAAAEETLRRGIELSESGRLPIFCDIYRALSETYLRQGRVTEAVEAAHQALDVARANEGPREVGTAWRALGEAIGAMSDSQGAPRCFEESMRLFTERNVAAELGRTLRAWARYELQSGDRAAGAELWQRARSTFAAHGLRHELERTPELASV